MIHDQPAAPDMPAGSVTDDMEQALIVADLLVQGGGHIDPQVFAQRLLQWEDSMRARGSPDLPGPSTTLVLEQVIASTGKTSPPTVPPCMTPVGIATTIDGDTDHDAKHIYESCRVTHNTLPGFQDAALVAAALNYGIEGYDTHQSLKAALRSVPSMHIPAAWSPKANVAARAQAALDLVQEHDTDGDDGRLGGHVRNRRPAA
ncbi:ADP-ribosylglycohydrolase family protein [Bifidobacterium indicum]|uniref:ADP-ribosylglycohydrolase family protein n=1 Tax=Bifidobacterium indicum TaxID=1691 RepID=UPI0030DBAEF3